MKLRTQKTGYPSRNGGIRYAQHFHVGNLFFERRFNGFPCTDYLWFEVPDKDIIHITSRHPEEPEFLEDFGSLKGHRGNLDFTVI